MLAARREPSGCAEYGVNQRAAGRGLAPRLANLLLELTVLAAMPERAFESSRRLPACDGGGQLFVGASAVELTAPIVERDLVEMLATAGGVFAGDTSLT